MKTRNTDHRMALSYLQEAQINAGMNFHLLVGPLLNTALFNTQSSINPFTFCKNYFRQQLKSHV